MYLLVIGGNSDIGYAIAEKFYQIGYNIYLTKRNKIHSRGRQIN